MPAVPATKDSMSKKDEFEQAKANEGYISWVITCPHNVNVSIHPVTIMRT
jgi:hypothetical protein